MFDYIVVGKGMFGAAAARRLSATSANVAVIGPDEPTDPSRHTGVFASHYDQGRLQRHMSRNLVWAKLSHRAYREYAGIKAESGIHFYQPVDSVHLAPHRKDSVFVEAASETAERLGIACTMINRGDQVMERFPMLRFPLDSHGYIEHFPAGYINPRDLIRAQLAIAAGRGATIVPDTVMQIRKQGDRVIVVTGAGTTYEARKVLITVGAYCNSFDLVERKLALRVKSETIILARVSERECARLTGMPSMIYELEAPPIDTIYMLPPILYPDGQYYIKMGCNTESDRYLSTADDMGTWVRSGNSDVSLAAMEEVMRNIIPGLDAVSYETKRCIITYTPEVCPYIDQLDGERIFVATGGNGMGAKSSVAIGQIAADMMIHGRWVDEIAHEHFQVRYEDELAGTGFSWGSCGMAKRLPSSQPRTPSPAASADAVSQASAPRPQLLIRRRESTAFQPAGGIHMSNLHPWKGVADTPFGSAWAVVEPGQTSQRHMHHEGETWIVMEGRGVVSVDGESEALDPGDAVYMPPFTKHTMHNPSGHERLVFLTLWWEDLAAAANRAGASEHVTAPRASVRSARRVLVTITPPTPNGDLHLGHLAGPYLGADIYARALRMEGCTAHYVTGSDDFQSYVAGKALRTGQTPEQVADHYAGGIETALRAAGVRCDQFSRNLRAPYVSLIQGMVAKLYAEGHIIAKECDYLVSPTDGRPLFEFYVSGTCPHCGSPAGGGCCEECGRLNEGIGLVDPVATLGGNPLGRKRISRLVLPLGRYADRVRALLDRMPMSTHLRSLAEGLLADGLPDVPVTHPHHWGLPCTVAGFEGQVISTWFEMGHSMLEGFRQYRRRAGGSFSEQSMAPEAGTEVVQFFGFDNGFYYALLYPLLYQLVDPGFEPPAALVCNEFYLLDGLKFSTSRNHAIWVRDILEKEPADLVRFYLAHTRPESERTSFTTPAYQAFVNGELRGIWQTWLRDLGQRVHDHFAGVAPEPGLWTDAHRRYYGDIEALLRYTREAYQAHTFSTQTVTHQLVEMVRRARDLGHAELPLGRVARRRDEYRTAMALELASARALAQYVTPIMPVFAQRLWSALGLEGQVEAHGFDAHLAFVPAGARVALSKGGQVPPGHLL